MQQQQQQQGDVNHNNSNNNETTSLSVVDDDSCRQLLVVPKGIINVSGVSCHFTCILQLVIHGMEPLRRVLMENTSRDDDGPSSDPLLVNAMSRFVQEYCWCISSDSAGGGAVDPSHLLTTVKKETKIDPLHVGDAAMAMRLLVKALGKDLPQWNRLWTSGTYQQQLVGRRQGSFVRKTPMVERDMMCPFLIQITSESTTCLSQAFIKTMSVTIEGFDWDQAVNYEESAEEEATDDNESNDTCWTTRKVVGFRSLPHHLMLQLQYSFSNGVPSGSTVRGPQSELDVPEILQVPLLSNDDESCPAQNFRLKGGVILIHDDSDGNDDDDDAIEGGHYIAIIQSDSIWYLLDDDKVHAMESSSAAIDILSGRGKRHCPSLGRWYTTTILHYSSTDHPEPSPILVTSDANQNVELLKRRPNELVGKRLSILWSKGTYYSGIVSNYDKETKRHTVTYDDGDTRTYKLHKKTFVWE